MISFVTHTAVELFKMDKFIMVSERLAGAMAASASELICSLYSEFVYAVEPAASDQVGGGRSCPLRSKLSPPVCDRGNAGECGHNGGGCGAGDESHRGRSRAACDILGHVRCVQEIQRSR
jgi:hypothetical protein